MEEPVETILAYDQKVRRYESAMYGTRHTCTCEPFQQYPGNKCWHIIAVTVGSKYWPQWVADAVSAATAAPRR